MHYMKYKGVEKFVKIKSGRFLLHVCIDLFQSQVSLIVHFRCGIVFHQPCTNPKYFWHNISLIPDKFSDNLKSYIFSYHFGCCLYIFMPYLYNNSIILCIVTTNLLLIMRKCVKIISMVICHVVFQGTNISSELASICQ